MEIKFDTRTISLWEIDSLLSILAKLKENSLIDDEISAEGVSTQDLSDEDVLAIVHSMHDYGLKLGLGISFKATELYRKSGQGNWLELSSNTRKAIGRQFKKVANEYAAQQEDGAIVIEFKERNIQNTAIYHVARKGPL